MTIEQHKFKKGIITIILLDVHTHSAGTLSYFKSLKIAPKERFGIRILYGASCGNCLHLLHACHSYQLPLLSSDSHGKEYIGDMAHAIKLIEQIDYPDHLILNHDTRAFLRSMALTY